MSKTEAKRVMPSLVGEFQQFGPAVTADFQGLLVLAVGASEGVRANRRGAVPLPGEAFLGLAFLAFDGVGAGRLASTISFLNSSIEP